MNDATYAIAMAMVSLAAAGILDIVFKKFAVNVRGLGMYAAGCGIVWGTLQTIYFVVVGSDAAFNNASLLYGTAAGASLILANLIMIGCLRHMHVSVGSTIYRLNTVAVVILSIIFLSEPVVPLRLGGVGAGIAAVLLLYWANRGDNESVAGQAATGFFRLILLASFLRAVYGVITKSGLENGADANAMLLIAAAFWVLGGGIYAFIIREPDAVPFRRRAAYAAYSGTIIFFVVNTLLEGLKYGDATVVIPIANLSFILAATISMILGIEKPSPLKFAAIAVSGVSIVLISQSV